MSIDRNTPGRPELYAINGGGEEDKESRLRRARAAVESALGLRHESQEGPYGHLSPVAPAEAEPEPRPARGPAGEPTQDGRTSSAVSAGAEARKVVPITEAPSHRARQIDSPGIAEGTSALEDAPMPVSADGEIDERYHRIREARLEVETARQTMPKPDISQPEDLFR